MEKAKKVGHVGFLWLLIGGEGRVEKRCEMHVGYHVILENVHVLSPKKVKVFTCRK